mgnify:CR=1 FL=1
MKKRMRPARDDRALSNSALDQVGGGFWDWFGWGGGGDSGSADLEGMIQKRSDMFDMLRDVIDVYDTTEPSFIGTIPR